MLISISLENKRSPKEYGWYKFTGIRNVAIPLSKPSAEMETGDIYGIRSVGENFHLIYKDHPNLLFRVPAKLGQLIIKRSEGWSGKVGRYAVSSGVPKTVEDTKPRPRPRPKPTDDGPFVPPSTKLPAGKLDEKSLTSRLKKLDVVGMRGIRFLMSQEPLPDEMVYYYDADSVYRAYSRQLGIKVLPKTWGDDIEAMIEELAPDLDIECATVKYMGEVKHLLSVEK